MGIEQDKTDIEDTPDEIKGWVEDKPKPNLDQTITINIGTPEKPKEIKIGADLTLSQKTEITELLTQYEDVFAWSHEDMIGLSTDIVVHKLPIKEGFKPVKQKLRKLKPEWSLKVKEEIVKQFKAGIIMVSTYPEWLSNIVPVAKPGGKVRVCVDYRDLNKASLKDNFPVPFIHILVDNTAQYEMYSFVDCFAGYHQIMVAEEDREKTAFITPWGTFCYRRLAFGLTNAGATYQRAMMALFHDMMHKEIEVYVDDIIVKSKAESDHVVHLKKLFDRLRKYNLKLNPAKCAFGVQSGKLLGFLVSHRGIELDPAKIQAIVDMPAPRTEKEVRGFLGRINFISRFISHLTTTCEPIFKLLRKGVSLEWNQQCQKAFDAIKKQLIEAPVLVPPKDGIPLFMYISVNVVAMGCMLGQKNEAGKEQAIYYLSKRFSRCEQNYTPIERTCCALAWAAVRLQHYLHGHTTYLISRMDPLKYIFERPMLNCRLSRWQLILQQFDIVYITQKAMKGQGIADQLSDTPAGGMEPLETPLPGEDVFWVQQAKYEDEGQFWKMYSDGAVNAEGAGAGAVLVSITGEQYPVAVKLKFSNSNNTAEYEGCILGLRLARDMGVKRLAVFGDSELVIKQAVGVYSTKELRLLPYHKCVIRLMQEFEDIAFRHIPRGRNDFADALATLASLASIIQNRDIPQIEIAVQMAPAYEEHVAVLTGEGVQPRQPWFHDIREYLRDRSIPDQASRTEKVRIQRMAMRFYLSGDSLYKRDAGLGLLRCVDEIQAQKIMDEVHGGVCGPHMSGPMLAKKILRTGHYWLSLQSDCDDHVKRCYQCQAHGNVIHVPPSELHCMTAPWPFSMWGIDVIGPVEPKASNGHRFILVMIDYFTKWVEAASFPKVTQEVIVNFIRNNVICRYGQPEVLVSDNAKNLNNAIMGELCGRFKIKHLNSVIYRPKMNGAVEAANKNIKKIMARMSANHRGWPDLLPLTLLAYRTSVRTSTGATPYALVYGMEAVLPVEVEMASLRILIDAQMGEEEWMQSRYDQLTLIDEKRVAAVLHGQLYQQRMARAYDKRVRSRRFKENDLVLKRIVPCQDEAKGKFAPNWEGPFVVKKVLSGGALILQEMDGEVFPQPLNADSVKRFYA